MEAQLVANVIGKAGPSTDSRGSRAPEEGSSSSKKTVISIAYLVDHPTNRKWVISPVINGIIRVNPLVTGDITYLLSEMIHQVVLQILSFRRCLLDPKKEFQI